jgi:hypothetical protein
MFMAVEWIQRQRQKSPSYAINMDSKSALLAIANKRTTHPLAVATRKNKIELTHWHIQPAVRRAEPSMHLLLILALCQ